MGEGPVSLGRRNEVVLISGCSDGGIGTALALEFCDNDSRLLPLRGRSYYGDSSSRTSHGDKKEGQVVNVGSIITGVYASSKAALQASTDALRLELKPFNIDGMLLVPGGVVTGLASKGADLLRNNLSALQIFKPHQEYLLKRTMISHHPNYTQLPFLPESRLELLLQNLLLRLSRTISCLKFTAFCIAALIGFKIGGFLLCQR